MRNNHSMSLNHARRRSTVLARLAIAAAFVITAACKDFLTAENPGAIEETDLNDAVYLGLLVNGVIGEFQPHYAEGAMWSGMFADELRNHHNFFENPLIDQRRVTPENGTISFFYFTPLNRARFMADSVAGRLRVILGDSATQDVRLARVLAYGGYTYILMGENLCVGTVDLSRPYTPAELFGFANVRFAEAIQVAAAAKARAQAIAPATTASTAIISAADSITNFARIGAARAYLDLNNKPKAIEFATPVPTGFEFRAYFTLSNTNRMWTFMPPTGEKWFSVNGTPNLNLKDPRVPHPTTTERVSSGVQAFVPNSPSAFNTYDGTITGAEFDRAGYMRVASHLEARYIIAESNGPTAASIAFVESRRLIQPAPQNTPVTTAANFFANLREQRRRDFYLDYHRLGDLRRYKEFYGIDEFQKGAYPGTTTGESYGDQECLPLNLAEITGNPNVPKP